MFSFALIVNDRYENRSGASVHHLKISHVHQEIFKKWRAIKYFDEDMEEAKTQSSQEDFAIFDELEQRFLKLKSTNSKPSPPPASSNTPSNPTRAAVTKKVSFAPTVSSVTCPTDSSPQQQVDQPLQTDKWLQQLNNC